MFSTRLRSGLAAIELEHVILPIPIDDSLGKEIIIRISTNMSTAGTWWTDSQGQVRFLNTLSLRTRRNNLSLLFLLLLFHLVFLCVLIILLWTIIYFHFYCCFMCRLLFARLLILLNIFSRKCKCVNVTHVALSHWITPSQWQAITIQSLLRHICMMRVRMFNFLCFPTGQEVAARA